MSGRTRSGKLSTHVSGKDGSQTSDSDLSVPPPELVEKLKTTVAQFYKNINNHDVEGCLSLCDEEIRIEYTEDSNSHDGLLEVEKYFRSLFEQFTAYTCDYSLLCAADSISYSLHQLAGVGVVVTATDSVKGFSEKREVNFLVNGDGKIVTIEYDFVL